MSVLVNFTNLSLAIFLLAVGKLCTSNSLKAGNDVIDILTGEDMENTPFEFRMWCRMNLKSGLCSNKTVLSRVFSQTPILIC